MTYNGKFCQKSGLDWLKMANVGHFAGLSIISPKMRLRLTWNGQFHPIHNFSHLLPPKHLILGEISKIFIPGGGGYIGKYFEFFNLFESFHTESSSKWSTKANFATKVAWISSECVILVKCQQKLKYLSRILTDLHWTFRTGLIFLSWSKWVQGVLCYDQNWWKLISQWNLDRSCTKPLEQGSFFPSWLKWVQGVLCYDQNWWKLKYLSRISIDLH